MHLSIYNLHIDMSIPKDHVLEQAVDFAEAVCVSVRDRENTHTLHTHTTHARTHTHTHTHTHTSTHTDVHIYTHARTHAHRQSARSRAPVRMKVSIHVFMYVSTNRYTH